MSGRGTVDRLAVEVVAALRPLRRAFSDEQAFRSLMRRLGWEAAGLPPQYADVGTAIADAARLVDSLGDAPTPAAMADLIVKSRAAYQAVRGIAVAPPGVDATSFLASIGEQLFELLLTEYLAAEQPAAFNLLSALGVIEAEDVAATPHRRAFVRTQIRWQEIPKIVSDPGALPARLYGWGTPELRFQLLIGHLAELLFALGFPVTTEPVSELLADAYHDAGDGLDDTAWALKVPFYYITIANKNLEAAFRLLELKGDGTSLPGVVLEPHIPEQFPLKFHIAPTIDLRVMAGTNAASQFGILLRPGDATIRYPFQPGKTPPAAGVGLGFDFTPATPTVLLGTEGGTRLEMQGGSVDFGAKFDGQELDVVARAQARGLALVLAGDDTDSFLQSFVGRGASRVEIPLGLEWSRRDGVHFSSSDGFAIAVKPDVKLGPLSIDSLALRLDAPSDGSADIALTTGLVLSGEIGPVTFVIDGIGFRLGARLTAGNLGPIDVSAGFKAPTGIGLAIDADVVRGGGFLSFDPAKGQYSGTMFLEFDGGIAVTALGMLTTRMPDGSKGYSLIIVITAEGFTPIQLGYGFILTGMGGLVGVNRTFDEAALRAGLKQHTLDAVMFPRDPVRNAPAMLSTLNRVFPPAAGHHLLGPMVQIAWGSASLITADVGVVLEFGARLRLLLLAQVAAILPNRQHDVVRLQLDAVGVVDLDQGTASLDASLYDSRLLKTFVLTGDMAMRMNWHGSPNFALAVGGLHPAFNPPPNFPTLERVAITLSSGDNPRIRCEAYFALTSNTVQFGARLELKASASGFTIHGETGFDVLIQLDPFAFVATFFAQVQLKRGSTNLFKVRVDGALAGPRPLHIKAKATFEILWWDVSVKIDRTLVQGEKPPAPAAIVVMPRLREALGQASSWVPQLPGGRPLVTFRTITAAPGTVLVHPLGTLTVKQTVVPLDIDISRFGPGPPSGSRRFAITRVTVGTRDDTAQAARIKDFFAPAQFFEMTDEAKLSRPSFESMNAGIGFGSDAFDLTANGDDWLEVEQLEFDTITVRKDEDTSRRSAPDHPYVLMPALLARQSRYGAAGGADVRRSGRDRYRSTVGRQSVSREGWTLVATDDMTPQAAPTNYSEARQALVELQRRDPVKAARLTILRRSELT